MGADPAALEEALYRDIKRRDARENLRDTVVGLFVADNPQLMAEAVGSREIVFRGVVLHHVGHDGVDLGVVGIGEEHRFDIGIIHTNMLHTVFFLIATGQLMFLDRAIHIIGNISPDYQPILSLAIHGLGINIIAFFLILNQPTFFLKIIEIGGGLQVNSRIMLIRPFWEIDFRFNDMVKEKYPTYYCVITIDKSYAAMPH